jgi:hypothetical protein
MIHCLLEAAILELEKPERGSSAVANPDRRRPRQVRTRAFYTILICFASKRWIIAWIVFLSRSIVTK